LYLHSSVLQPAASTCRKRAPRDPISQDMYTTKSLDEVSSEPPSLVSQLQQVHGLTKKKVYGTKPALVPFIKDERVRDRYCRAPTPLTMPLPLSIPSENGPPPSLVRRSRGKANRAFSARHERMSDPYLYRQSPWSISSAEGDSSDQSPYSSSSLSLPPSPVTQMPEGENYAFGGPNSSVAAAPNPNTSDTMHSAFYPPFPSAPTLQATDNMSLTPGAQAPFHCAVDFHDNPRAISPPFLAYIPPAPRAAAAFSPGQDFHSQCFPYAPEESFSFADGGRHFPQGQTSFPQEQQAFPTIPQAQTAFPQARQAFPHAEPQPTPPIPMTIMQPTPISPPISAHCVEGLIAASSQTPNIRQLNATCKRRGPSSSGRPRSAGAFVSSLTGWAGW
jgi:hypothetical protein